MSIVLQTNTRFLAALSLFFFLFAPAFAQKNNLTQVEAKQRAALIFEPAYAVELHFTKSAKSANGSVTISFLLESASEDIWLDFEGTVHAVRINGEAFDGFRYDSNRARLHLERAWLAGRHSVEIDYTIAYDTPGNGLQYYRDPADGREYLYTDFQPNNAHKVLPCFDQPEPRATFALTLHLPTDWEAAANGRQRSKIRTERGNTIVFEKTPPIPAYLFNLVVGEYAVWSDTHNGMGMRILARQEMEGYVDEESLFAMTKAGLDFFADYFDRALPFTHYDQSFVPNYHAGAMENPGSVILNEFLILGYNPSADDQRFRDQVVLHELAHMWFGNLVTMSWWDDLWLSEAFASYMEIVALRGLERGATWRIALASKENAYLSDRSSLTHAVIGEVADTRTAAGAFNSITYDKGLGVLRQLETDVGVETFRDAMRRYLQTHAWSNTTFADFRRAFEAVAKRDMDAWFEAWLKSPGINTLSVDWDVIDGKLQHVVLRQKPDAMGRFRPHTVELGFFEPDDERGLKLAFRERVKIENAERALPQLNGRAAPVLVQPNLRELTYALVDLDARSVDWLRENAASIKGRGLIYQLLNQLWHSVRGGTLPAQDWLTIALPVLREAVFSEQSDELMRRAFVAADLFLSDVAAAKAHEQLFELIKAKVTAEDDPNVSDRWLNYLLKSARTDEQIEYIVALAGGDEGVANLSFDLDEIDRWEIAGELIEAGHPRGEDMLKVLRLVGEQGLLEIMVPWIEGRRPSAEDKAKAWARATNPEADLTLDQRYWLMEGFHTPRDPKRTSAYTKPFFTFLAENYQTVQWPFLEMFVYHMFPRYDTKNAGKAARAFIKREDIPLALRRLIADELFEIEAAITHR